MTFDIAEPVDAMHIKTTVAEEQYLGSNSEKGNSDLQTPGPKMRKRFNFTSLLGFFIAGAAGWEAIIASLYQVLIGGGPSVLVWGFVISAVAACCIAFSMAEFASIWPSAAGQYHWAVALAPTKWKVLVGWYSSWILLMMNLLSSLSALFAGSFSIQALVIITVDSYVAERWHAYLMICCILLIGAIINVFLPRALHYISIFGLVVHLLGFFAIIITLLACTKKKNSAKEVFGSFENYTSYSSNGVAFLIGLLPTCTGFTAMDMPARYSEETAKPHTDVSRSMFWGVLAASAIGLPFVIVIAFCMGDPAVLLTSNIAALSPMAQIVYNSTGSLGAAITLCSCIVIVAVVSAIDCLGSISRIIMAQARDQGFPAGEFFSQIHPRWNTPANAIVLAAFAQACLAVIYVGNATAFYGILSGEFTLQILSFGLPVALHLFRRKKLNLTYGPWKMGVWGWLVNAVGLCLYCFLFVAVSLPTAIPVTAAGMNYATPIVGITLILTTVLYIGWGRRVYYGPLVELPGVMYGTSADAVAVPDEKL